MSVGWTPKLSVGFAKIDQQHAELLRRFNQLQDACRNQQGKEQIRELFDFLDHEVMAHFTDEERLMLQHRYPRIMAHQQEHLELITRLRKLKRQLHEYNLSGALVVEITQTLFQWIVDHIQQTDTALGAYLSSRESPRI